MRNGYRFPKSSIAMMSLAFMIILYILARTGMLISLGGSMLIFFAVAALLGAVVGVFCAKKHKTRLEEIEVNNSI
jgi:positive regulator of sigma E activity